MSAAEQLRLSYDAERALVKPFDEADAQEGLVKLYGLNSAIIPANEVPRGHDPAKFWRPNPRQELFLRNPTWELFYGGQGGGGKALALTTPIPTPNGWTTMGALQVGDVVFDERGAPCTVLAATEPMFDHEVFDVVFDDGSRIRADADHRWFTTTRDEYFNGHLGGVRTTREICEALARSTQHWVESWFDAVTVCDTSIGLAATEHSRLRQIVAVEPVPTEPVRCIKVDSPSHLFLAGREMIPTHNSDALLVDALSLVQHRDHRALLLRRSYVDLVRYIIPRSQVLYPRVGGVWKASARRWHFPSGATIELGACDNVENIHRFAGAAYNWIGWDELTHFAESQYLFMFSRLRSASGLPTYYRAASNPGGPGHDWVLERFAPWLRGGKDRKDRKDPDYEGVEGEDGKPICFVRNEDGNEVIVPKGTPMARARSFIQATVFDNPFLASSEYIANMNAMSKLDRARIMHGDWLAKPGAGLIFEGAWFKNPDTKHGDPERPTNTVARIRYWDLAGTEQARAKEGTAFTAGILMSAEVIGRGLDGTPLVRIWIEDIIRGQWHPAGVINKVNETMKNDMLRDAACLTYIERDPGQAGAMQAWYMAALAGTLGHHLRPVPPQGSKIDRARTPSAHAEQGHVWLIPSKWNKVFREELQSFPDGLKDQVDSYTGGFRQIMMLARNAGGGGGSSSTSSIMDPEKNIRKRGGF
jgi:predicted phage terminase large subunit-like protein